MKGMDRKYLLERVKKYGLEDIGKFYCLEKIGNLVYPTHRALDEKNGIVKYPLKYGSFISFDINKRTKVLTMAQYSLAPVGFIWIDRKKLKVVRCTPKKEIEKNLSKLHKRFLKKITKRNI